MNEATSAKSDYTMPVRSANEFYVGYLKMPEGYAFFVRMMLPVILWLAVGVAMVVSSSQSDPGNGSWRTGQPVTLQGMISTSPYPMVRIPTAQLDRPFETVLLVQTGKFGGGSRVTPFEGRLASVTGWIIERNGRRMLELAPEDESIRLFESAPESMRTLLQEPAARSVGRITLRGEIVDSKCYLGVMKPGEGKTHKECATLCIRGGIPPMFVVREPSKAPTYYVLSNAAGTGLDSDFLPFVADAVEVTGDVEELGDILLLRVMAANISRL